MLEIRHHEGAAPRATEPGSGKSSSRHGCGQASRKRRPRAQSLLIMELRSFDFSTIDIKHDVYVVLCPAICVLAYTRVRLSVRVHALTMSAGQTLQFLVWNTLPSEEDPAHDFVAALPLTSVSITSATGVPSLVTSPVAYDPDAYLKISLLAVQDTGSAPPLRATLSACLLLRPG